MRCEDEKMFYRPPLLEEPCAQTLSGKMHIIYTYTYTYHILGDMPNPLSEPAVGGSVVSSSQHTSPVSISMGTPAQSCGWLPMDPGKMIISYNLYRSANGFQCLFLFI